MTAIDPRVDLRPTPPASHDADPAALPVAIADAELNITLAASRVHATQPGLSKQLKQLEDELGFLLFVRRAAA